jgi:hypothetical protein
MRRAALAVLTPCALVGVLVGPPPAFAAPITYDIGFTLQTGSLLPSSGSFTYDSALNSISAFTVTWEGFTYDFTGRANVVFPSVDMLCGVPAGTLLGIQIMFKECPVPDFQPLTTRWFGLHSGFSTHVFFEFDFCVGLCGPRSLEGDRPINVLDPRFSQDFNSLGDWTLTPRSSEPTTAPEPASSVLVTSGVLSLLLARRKSAILTASRRA